MDNDQLAIMVSSGVKDSDRVESYAAELANRLQLPLITVDDKVSSDYEMLLCVSANGLWLESPENRKKVKVQVDFDAGAINHRVGDAANGQAIAKAVGVKPGLDLSVLDGTAGFGKDSFLLASLGCNVTMLERNKIVHALLNDGLSRAGRSTRDKTRNAVKRMQLELGEFNSNLDLKKRSFDVVFLDPMFPLRRKSAKVKKEMVFLQKLLANEQGSESDSDSVLLQYAIQVARRRVVIKRARHAENFADKDPDYSLTGRTNRFDVYLVSG